MFDAVGIGELLIDFSQISADDQGFPTVTAHPGGAPANLLAVLQKYGARTAMIGKVGLDVFGRLLICELQRLGIDTAQMVQDPDVFTTMAFVTLEANGERHFSFARKPGADSRLRACELDPAYLAAARLLHFCLLPLTSEPARGAVRQAVAQVKSSGGWVSFDPNLRLDTWESPDLAREQMRWALRQANVVKLSEEEAEFLLGAAAPEVSAERLAAQFDVDLVFLTLGAAGCVYASAGTVGRVPAMPDIRAIDTTGAGDIFFGAALWHLLRPGRSLAQLEPTDLRDAAFFAAAAAGLSTERFGAIDSIPELDTVLRRAALWQAASI